MMEKWLKPKMDSYLLKQLEREAQRKKEALCVQEFNKRSTRVFTRLSELEHVHNRIVAQLVPESHDCRHKSAISDYITDEKALTTSPTSWDILSQRIWKKKRFHEVPPGSHHRKLLNKEVLTKGKCKLSNKENKYKGEQNWRNCGQ